MSRYHGTFPEYVGRLTAKIVTCELRRALYHAEDRTHPKKLAEREPGTRVVSTYRRHPLWGAPVKRKRRKRKEAERE